MNFWLSFTINSALNAVSALIASGKLSPAQKGATFQK